MCRKPSFSACRSRFREVVSSGITRETWLKPFSPIPEEARKQIESSLIGMTFHTDRGPMENEKPIAATILTAVAVAIAVWATIGAPPLHPQYGVKRVVASRP
jgi:hypothetical protein